MFLRGQPQRGPGVPLLVGLHLLLHTEPIEESPADALFSGFLYGFLPLTAVGHVRLLLYLCCTWQGGGGQWILVEDLLEALWLGSLLQESLQLEAFWLGSLLVEDLLVEGLLVEGLLVEVDGDGPHRLRHNTSRQEPVQLKQDTTLKGRTCINQACAKF